MSKETIDFIGVGAPKSGSTWVGQILEEHPQVLFSSEKTRKELYFFNEYDFWGDKGTGRLSYYNRGLEWYFDQFPKAKKGCIRGEFSATYLSDRVAYKRIKKDFPNAKILVSLRNPADLLYSLHWYIHNGAVMSIPSDFESTLENEYLTKVAYFYKHLKNFYDVFDKKQIHVIFHDDIISDPKKVSKDLYAFLNVDEAFIPDSIKIKVNAAFKVKSRLLKDITHIILVVIDRLRLEKIKIAIYESSFLAKIYTSLNKVPFKYPKMTPEQRKKCYEIFKDDIEDLEMLLGRDLSSWKV
ncbi:sulfotransferase [Patescibacteria group bacterium]